MVHRSPTTKTDSNAWRGVVRGRDPRYLFAKSEQQDGRERIQSTAADFGVPCHYVSRTGWLETVVSSLCNQWEAVLLCPLLFAIAEQSVARTRGPPLLARWTHTDRRKSQIFSRQYQNERQRCSDRSSPDYAQLLTALWFCQLLGRRWWPRDAGGCRGLSACTVGAATTP